MSGEGLASNDRDTPRQARIKELQTSQRVDARGLRPLARRVASLEARMSGVEATAAATKADTDEILSLIKTAKGVGGFVHKWGRALIVAGVGAGLFNPQVTQFFKSLLSF